MSLPYRKQLIPRAKDLRSNSTKQENRLWYDFLREYPVRFQRQKTIDHFIVDFYCHKAKLVIELDGSQHYTEQGSTYDTERSAVLSEHGLSVLRFSNSDVDKNFSVVCSEIHRVVQERLTEISCDEDQRSVLHDSRQC